MRRKTLCVLMAMLLLVGCAGNGIEEATKEAEISVENIEETGETESSESAETTEEIEISVDETDETEALESLETESEETEESTDEASETYTVMPLGRAVADSVREVNEATLANADSNVVDIFNIEFSAEKVRALIEAYTFPEYQWMSGEIITEEKKASIEANRNLESLNASAEDDESTWEVSYGILMKNAAVRSFPTDERITETADNSEKSFDYFQESLLFIGEPVVLLHTSADGVYTFVQGLNYNGWVKTEYIQVCSKELAQDFWECADFVVITQSFYDTGDASDNTSLFRMGTVLPLASETDEAYIAVIGCDEASADGVFSLLDGELIYDTDVSAYEDGTRNVLWVRSVQISKTAASAGYLEYTAENLLTLADAMVGNDYSWGDENIGYDCSSTVGSIYRCFGYVLPRNSKDMKYTGANVTLLDDMTAEEKRAYITSLEPGAILVLPGHAMLYIGYQIIDDTDEAVPVLLHCVTGYATESGEIVEPYACVKTSIDINTRGEQSYLELLTVCVTLQ